MITPAITLILMLTTWWQVSLWYRTRLIEEQRTHVQENLIPLGNTLTTAINQRFAQLEGLAAFAHSQSTSGTLAANFDAFAAGLYAGKTVTRAIQIFPHEGPVLVYPISGNEASIGRTLNDLINDERPNVRADVQRAIETRRIATSGPYELRQGGLGFLARLAIFQDDELWGIAVIIIDLPPLFSDIQLDTPPKDTELALRDSNNQLLIGQDSTFDADPATYQIQLPESNWTLAMIPSGGWNNSVQTSWLAFRLVSLVIVALSFSLLSLLLTRQTSLAQAVRQRTTELDESQARSRALFENNNDNLLVTDPQGRIMDVNASACRRYGYSREEFLTLTQFDLAVPELNGTVQERLARAQHEPIAFESQHRSKDGTVFPVEIKAQPVMLGGQPHILNSARDITERKQAQTALHESEERYRLLVDQSPYAIGVIQEGLVVFANPAAARMLRAEHADDLIGKPIREIIHPDSWEMMRTQINLLLQGTPPAYPREDRFLRLDGQVITVEVTASPFTFKDQPAIQVIVLDITTRKLTEQALQETAEQLRLAVNAANVGLWDWNILTNKVYYSPEWKRQLGYDVDEIGDDLDEWDTRVHPDDHDTTLSTLNAYLANPTPSFQIEFRLRHKDGSYRWLLSQASLMLDNNDTPIRMLGAHIDITEQKRAERALRSREERFRLAMDNIPDVVTIYDRDLRIQFINSATAAITGRTPDDFIGRTDDEVFPPEIYETYLPTLKEAYRTRSICTVETSLSLAGNPPRALSITCVPVLNDRGEVREILGITHDFTERKQFEQALRENEEKLRLFIEHAPASLAMFDTQMRYLAVSRRWLNDYALGDINVTGQSHYTIFPEIPEYWKDAHQRALAGEILKTDEDEFVRKDGSIQWLRWEIHPWYTSEKTIGGIVIFTEDITTSKQAAEEIRQLNASLEQRVIDRTAALEAKTRELETFTYSVSHDLKAPLRGIDGYSRLLLEDYADRLDEDGKTFLHNIRHAATQMSQLIDDLLVYSRLERRDLPPGHVISDAWVQNLLTEYADDIRARGVTLTVHVPQTTVSANPEGLAMALRNLINNAFKFTRDVTQPAITIGGRETDTSCILWVQDNGIGFDMQYHDRIFEIFQRLHRAEEYAGTGVGLAIVRKALERMGGRVWAESELSHGATFFLEIPK